MLPSPVSPRLGVRLSPTCASAHFMASTLDQIETPCLRKLYGYWASRRGSNEFPARRDIDPLDFPEALGHVVLLDVLYEPLRFRFRLHGTELVRHAGYDMTGKMADDLP